MKGKALGFPHGAGRVPSCTKQPNFSSLLLDFTLVRLLGAFSGPLRRVVALYVVLGRSLWTLVGQLVFKVADGVGWLSAPPRSPVLRSVGRGIITVRRWHYTIGEPRDLSTSLTHASRAYYPACSLVRLLTGAVLLRSEHSAVHSGMQGHPGHQGGQRCYVPGAEAVETCLGAGKQL